MFNFGAVLICLGLLLQFCLLGAKSFLLAHSRPLLILLLLALGWLAFRSLTGVDPHAGASTFRTAVYKGFALFIVGMQLVLYPRYIKLFLAAAALAVFVQGLDGIWQYCTGYDFIKNAPTMGGRLTGAFSTYRVGNLAGMLLLFLPCLPFLFPQGWSAPQKMGLLIIVLFPPLFLWIFADARSSFNFIFAAFVSLAFLRWGVRWKIILPTLFLIILAVCFGVSRYSPETMMQDGRIREIWPFAWEVFKANPLIGAGSAGFAAAAAELGFIPVVDPFLSHPHNIYLQFLAEQGIIGLIIWLAFFGSIILAGWRTLRPYADRGLKKLPPMFAALCWAGCCGYLVMGLTAHSFLRDWWLGFAMFYFGVSAGLIVLSKTDRALFERFWNY